MDTRTGEMPNEKIGRTWGYHTCTMLSETVPVVLHLTDRYGILSRTSLFGRVPR